MEPNEEESVYQRGLRLLAHRDHSVEELRRKLAGRGFPPPAIRAILSRMKEAGLLDDLRFAQEFVRERLRRRPMGRQGLLLELAKRGVERGVAKDAIDAVLREEGLDERALARRALQGWRRRSGVALRQFLMRRGFDGEVIREVAGREEWDHDE